jgi:uncharacterized protein (UPF0332 family)
MTGKENLESLVHHWLEKAAESVKSARSELEAGRLAFAVNRLYYAVFYVVTAAFTVKGGKHAKHSAVRASFHREFVKTGVVDRAFGRLYDELFHARQQGDYMPLVTFEEAVVWHQLNEVERFVNEFADTVNRELRGRSALS